MKKNEHEWRSLPAKCPECSADPETYYGRLVLPQHPLGQCPNHSTKEDPEGKLAPFLVPVHPAHP